ncbi:hypothetical protein JL720_4275 [Aureococcus anophagefferens]|nr:hypothetical protein JL720_4275 [Aureococcus anophagefferens]
MFKKIVVALALVASNAFMAPVNSVRSVRVSMREIGVREVVRLPPASSADVEAKLKEIVAEQLGVEQASITAEASFASDLGADSLDVVMKIEEEFGVELPDERAEEVQNLSDAVRVVNDLL